MACMIGIFESFNVYFLRNCNSGNFKMASRTRVSQIFIHAWMPGLLSGYVTYYMYHICLTANYNNCWGVGVGYKMFSISVPNRIYDDVEAETRKSRASFQII